jgi:hypothetical protein
VSDLGAGGVVKLDSSLQPQSCVQWSKAVKPRMVSSRRRHSVIVVCVHVPGAGAGGASVVMCCCQYYHGLVRGAVKSTCSLRRPLAGRMIVTHICVCVPPVHMCRSMLCLVPGPAALLC